MRRSCFLLKLAPNIPIHSMPWCDKMDFAIYMPEM